MKAVRFSQFGGPEVLEMVDLPDSHPAPGEVRIAVRAADVKPRRRSRVRLLRRATP